MCARGGKGEESDDKEPIACSVLPALWSVAGATAAILLCPICLGYTSQGGHNCRMTAGTRRGSSGRRKEAGGGKEDGNIFTGMASLGFAGNNAQGLTHLTEANNALTVVIRDRWMSMRQIFWCYWAALSLLFCSVSVFNRSYKAQYFIFFYVNWECWSGCKASQLSKSTYSGMVELRQLDLWS